jgi:hypothetical protein
VADDPTGSLMSLCDIVLIKTITVSFRSWSVRLAARAGSRHEFAAPGSNETALRNGAE